MTQRGGCCYAHRAHSRQPVFSNSRAANPATEGPASMPTQHPPARFRTSCQLQIVRADRDTMCALPSLGTNSRPLARSECKELSAVRTPSCRAAAEEAVDAEAAPCPVRKSSTGPQSGSIRAPTPVATGTTGGTMAVKSELVRPVRACLGLPASVLGAHMVQNQPWPEPDKDELCGHCYHARLCGAGAGRRDGQPAGRAAGFGPLGPC